MRRQAPRVRTRGGRPVPRGGAESTTTVRIDAIAAGGDGVGRIDGLACFVPRTAPGDLVQVAYTPHARYARGRVLQVLEASPDRIDAPCRHYTADRCGGCQLQHLSRPAQHLALRTIVRDAVHRVAHRDVALPDLVSDAPFAYRDRLTLTLRARGGSYVGGLHPHDDPVRVFALDECPIAHPRLVEAWVGVRRLLRDLPSTAPSTPLRLSLRLLRAPEAADLTDDVTVPPVALVLQGGVSWPSAHSWADAVAAAVSTVEAVWWEPAVGAAVQLHGPADNRALSFAQVNPRVASALRRHVLDTIVRRAPRHVVDAYCGQGDLSEALAGHGMVVTAIEADAHATARAALRLRPFDGSRVLTGLVEDVLADTLPADVVVLNPPRRGLDVRVAAALADRRDIGALVYISCDPATLARDLSRLPRWQLASLRCFDMFPQTAHVESVCVLTPGDS